MYLSANIIIIIRIFRLVPCLLVLQFRRFVPAHMEHLRGADCWLTISKSDSCQFSSSQHPEDTPHDIGLNAGTTKIQRAVPTWKSRQCPHKPTMKNTYWLRKQPFFLMNTIYVCRVKAKELTSNPRSPSVSCKSNLKPGITRVSHWIK